MESVSVSSATTSAGGQKCPEKAAGFALLPREYYSEDMASTTVTT
jgi:hypothetical protein